MRIKLQTPVDGFTDVHITDFTFRRREDQTRTASLHIRYRLSTDSSSPPIAYSDGPLREVVIRDIDEYAVERAQENDYTVIQAFGLTTEVVANLISGAEYEA